MNETQAMPSPGTYFATNSGSGSLADGLAFSSLRDGSLDEITAYAAMDAKQEIWKSGSDIQKSFSALAHQITNNEMHTNERLSDIEKAAIEAKYESRLETREAVCKLSEKIDSEAARTNDKIAAFRNETKDNFCALERRLDVQFDDLKQRELRAEVAILTKELAAAQAVTQTQNIITAIQESAVTTS